MPESSEVREVSPEYQRAYESVMIGMTQAYADELNRQRGMLDTIVMMNVNKLINMDPEQALAISRSFRGHPVAESQIAAKTAQSTPPETAEG